MTESRSAGGPKRLNAYLRKEFMRLMAEDIRLSALWHTLISEPLAGHTRPISYANGQLAVHADSAAWASRVRQQKQALCQCLQRDPFFEGLTDLSVRVAPAGSHDVLRPARARPAAARPSPRAIELLRSTVRTTRDPALQAAFNRLLDTVTGAPESEKKR